MDVHTLVYLSPTFVVRWLWPRVARPYQPMHYRARHSWAHSLQFSVHFLRVTLPGGLISNGVGHSNALWRWNLVPVAAYFCSARSSVAA